MKKLVYETKIDSRTALRRRIFTEAEHIRNHPNIVSATQSLLMCATITTSQLEDTLNNYCGQSGCHKIQPIR
jgi:hypothetical protein